MKTWFKKFRASVRLDRGKAPRESAETGEVRRFEDLLRTMDRELRSIRADEAAPAGLHAAIMRAVATAGREEASSATGLWLRRIAAGAFVLAAGCVVFWFVNRPAPNGNLESPPSFAAAFERGQELTQAAPQAVLEPLAGEMELLHRDLQHAVTFLADSMP